MFLIEAIRKGKSLPFPTEVTGHDAQDAVDGFRAVHPYADVFSVQEIKGNTATLTEEWK